ncbi:MAG: hypothetical protein FJ100_12425 [Deltaproteobacteria bacterium]|nr:hypothetical protein [Deltaproteobacteria bacterium]
MSTVSAHYSIAIVGTDLAGLAYGALCAKRGYRVLVIGQGPTGATYQIGGHTLCRRLELNYALGSPIVRRVFDELSLGLQLRNLPRPLDPAFQVVLPRARIAVSTDARIVEREFKREFPLQDAAISAFFREIGQLDGQVQEVLAVRPVLPPSGFLDGFKLRSLVKKYPLLGDDLAIDDPLAAFEHGNPFRAFVQAPFRFASGMVPARPYPATFARAVTELWRGTATFDQGPNALRELFEGIIGGSGDVRPKSVVQSVAVQRGRAARLVLRDRGETIGFDLLVCNGDPKRFCALIPQEMQDEEFHHTIHTLQPICHTFTGNFVVRAAAVPEAMGRHVFAVGELGESLEEDNLVHIAVDADQGANPPERELRLLTAAMRVPISAAAAGTGGVEGLLDRLQLRVEATVPFLREHLVFRHSPWQGWGQAPGGDDIDPAELQPGYGEAILHTIGTSPLATLTGYKNVLMGGNASFCGLGAEGPYLAAWNLYQHTLDKVALKQVF